VRSGAQAHLDRGAKRVLVMMDHQTKSGASKIVERCSYPLTGVRCANRIYTDLAVIDVTPQGLRVVEIVDGLTFDELQRLTGVPMAIADAQPVTASGGKAAAYSER
jgi:3-oxoadipate CoA-transferase beta subunit